MKSITILPFTTPYLALKNKLLFWFKAKKGTQSSHLSEHMRKDVGLSSQQPENKHYTHYL